MRKIRLFLCVSVLCVLAVRDVSRAGEARESGPEVVVRIAVPQAPPALPVLRMIESGAMRGLADLQITVWTAPEQLIAMVQDGNHHMFAFPLTVAAKLHNKGVGIKLTNVNTWGVTYFVTSDPDCASWGDLKGKTLFVPMKSSTPDALTQYFLGRAGLKPGRDLEVVYSTMPEIAQLLRSGKAHYATLLEPQVTGALSGNPSLRVPFSFEGEWQKIKGDESMIPNAGFGATTAFIDANPELVRAFEREYEKATNWVLEHPEEAGKLAEDHLGLRAATISAAIPRLGLHYKGADAASAEVEELFRLLFDFSPDMVGKKIPDATLYWK